MALVPCPECGREVSTLAAACPSCGAPINSHYAPSSAPPDPPKKRSVWKWILGVPVGLFAAVMVIGTIAGNTPEGKAKASARNAIDLCWQQQQRKSLDAGTAQFAAAACERMQDDFRRKFGHSP